MFFRKIILALGDTDSRTRVEVVEQVKRNMEEFLRIENVVEFIQMVFAIDGVQGPAHSQGSQNRTQAPRVQLYGSQEDSPNYDQRQCKADFASPDGLVQNRLINTGIIIKEDAAGKSKSVSKPIFVLNIVVYLSGYSQQLPEPALDLRPETSIRSCPTKTKTKMMEHSSVTPGVLCFDQSGEKHYVLSY